MLWSSGMQQIFGKLYSLCQHYAKLSSHPCNAKHRSPLEVITRKVPNVSHLLWCLLHRPTTTCRCTVASRTLQTGICSWHRCHQYRQQSLSSPHQDIYNQLRHTECYCIDIDTAGDLVDIIGTLEADSKPIHHQPRTQFVHAAATAATKQPRKLLRGRHNPNNLAKMKMTIIQVAQSMTSH